MLCRRGVISPVWVITWWHLYCAPVYAVWDRRESLSCHGLSSPDAFGGRWVVFILLWGWGRGGLILLLCIEKLWKTKYFMRSVVRHLYRINGNNVEKATSSISLVIKLRQNASDCPCATECLNCVFCRMNQSLRIPLRRHGCLRHIHGQRTGMYWCWCGNNADPAMDYIKCGKIRFPSLSLSYVRVVRQWTCCLN